MNKFKKIVITIDNKRENLEDFVADRILTKIDSSTKVDDLEKEAIIAGLTAGNAYLATYGIPVIPNEVKEKIADAGVKALNKANKLLQKQLKKKSKLYKDNHKIQKDKI